MKCELCKEGIEGVDWCYVKTNNLEGECYYHNSCFDEMYQDYLDNNRSKLECGCCGIELNDKEIAEGMEKCFPCIKGNCDICGHDKEEL